MNLGKGTRAGATVLAGLLTFSLSVPAHADSATYGNSLHGASTNETLELRYTGAAWNYAGSGHAGAWFKYVRNGKQLTYKEVTQGRVEDKIWDSPKWGDKGRTYFYWGSK